MSNDNPIPPNRQDPSSTSGSSVPSDKNKSTSQKNSKANQNQDPSLLNRIQSSATGLLRDTITNPNAHALGSDLGQLHGGAVNGKGSSSSSAARWAGMNGSQHYDSAGAAAASGAGASSSSRIGAAEGFRSASQENHTLFEPATFNQEEYFQNDYYGDEYSETKGKGKEKTSTSFPSSIPMDLSSSFDEYYEAAWIRHTAAAQHSNNQHHNTQHHHPQEQNPIHQDGAAVVSLLSDPSFQPEFADDNDNEHYLYEDTTVPAPLTADEIRILESFRRQNQQSSSTETHHKPNNNNKITSHSLIPDIDTFLAENDGISVGGTSDAALRDAVLHNLPGVEDWVAVNDRYQDEVWGYLRPALEAASKEIEENERESEPAREGPAVRRLKMILRHMQL